MKKIFVLFIIFSMITILSGLTFNVKNSDLSIQNQNGYSIIPNSKISGIQGKPSIPLKTFFFKIPPNKEIKSVKIIAENYQTKILENELLPNPLQQPLMMKSIKNISKDIKSYEKEYPENLLFNFKSGNCGNTKIGYISYFAAKYFHKKLFIPSNLKFEIILKDSRNIPKIKSNYASYRILNSLNLSQKSEPDTSGYLLIFPQKFETAYLPLISWRKKQGLKVYSKTIEEISENYEGMDLQEKIRKCIIDETTLHNISYVTLGADVDDIPVRYFFAFDCEYGASDDENNIPADMYYSCLDGNWDANSNGIYGEDDDDPDYFPDVFVSRITAKSSSEVSHYISRLISYEKGVFDNYDTAGGFSMDLWYNSHSDVCQNYIYDHYFPDNYDIDLLTGEDATVDNAIDLLNTNKNIVQHTGHANYQVLALERGYFYNHNCDDINNDFSGLFYSIGCWSSALDYSSIAEKILINDNGGFNGYIGNSRYGWGSPNAPGFGFSEFYQKEYFKNLFENKIDILSEGNALQKIPFIPYFSGVSVYKWCAYELNSIGDSYAQIITDNPQNLYYTMVNEENNLIVNLTDDYGLPVPNVVANLNNRNYFSNEQGIIQIEFPTAGTLNLYKKNFRNISVLYEGENISHQFFTSIDSILVKKDYLQGENIKLNLYLNNGTDDNYDCNLQFKYNNNLLSYENTPLNFHLSPHSYFNIKDSLFYIKSIAESEQIPANTTLPINVLLQTISGDSLDSIIIPIKIKSPDIKIVATDIDTLSNNYILTFRIKNFGNFRTADGEIILESDALDFSKKKFNITSIPKNSSKDFETFFTLKKKAAKGEIFLINFQFSTTINSNKYVFEDLIPINFGDNNFYDDFEGESKWSPISSVWKRVNTYSVSGDSSFSCRLGIDQTGVEYNTNSPLLNYMPNSEISFDYRYNVPMYGSDRLIVKIQHSGIIDTLLCVGSGGALSNLDPSENPFIYSDWANYDFKINEIINHPLENGEQFKIIMTFIKTSNADYLESENGIFIDNFRYFVKNESLDNFSDFGLKLYPNPSQKFIKMKFLMIRDKKAKISVFNIKGQKIDEMDFEPNKNKFERAVWNLGKNHSGFYIFRLDDGEHSYFKKAVIMK